MRATFRPIQWVGAQTPPAQRRSGSAAFSAGWSSTLELLDLELDKLDAKHVAIEADFRERDLRLDGMPLASARPPTFPGVRIAFDSKYGPLVYATDTYAWWQHNVRAIALSLQALRAVDRYGVTTHAEQYTGWRAIEASPAHQPLTAAAARDVLLALVGEVGPGADDSDRAMYRRALKIAHPDHGGTRESWDTLQEVRRALRL